MKRSFLLVLTLCVTMAVGATAGFAAEKKDPLAAWKATFDPSGAEYTYILSNISHPVIEGVGAGYRIRDRVWEASKGRLYVDFRPLAQLGGEKDVINKLKLGAVHGMLSSSVAAQNVADTLGIVNMPYVVDTFDKLDTFRNTPELWQPFADSALKSGIMTVDVTGYGPYGWATNTPVKTIADAKTINGVGHEVYGHALAGRSPGVADRRYHRPRSHRHRLQHHQEIHHCQELHRA
jgi:TRAP-type C4-dicarboxylate transport system substrate-binding protein